MHWEVNQAREQRREMADGLVAQKEAIKSLQTDFNHLLVHVLKLEEEHHEFILCYRIPAQVLMLESLGVGIGSPPSPTLSVSTPSVSSSLYGTPEGGTGLRGGSSPIPTLEPLSPASKEDHWWRLCVNGSSSGSEVSPLTPSDSGEVGAAVGDRTAGREVWVFSDDAVFGGYSADSEDNGELA